MKNKYLLLSGTVICLFLLSIISCERDTDRIPEKHQISIRMIDDKWKVVDARDATITDITVARGDTVVWVAPPDSDLYFQFMDEHLVGHYTQDLKKEQRLMLTIGNQARRGPNPYAVFMYDAKVYAQGDSPPQLIVKE